MLHAPGHASSMVLEGPERLTHLQNTLPCLSVQAPLMLPARNFLFRTRLVILVVVSHLAGPREEVVQCEAFARSLQNRIDCSEIQPARSAHRPHRSVCGASDRATTGGACSLEVRACGMRPTERAAPVVGAKRIKLLPPLAMVAVDRMIGEGSWTLQLKRRQRKEFWCPLRIHGVKSMRFS